VWRRKGKETHSERVSKESGTRCASPYSGGEKTRNYNSQGHFRHSILQPIIGPKVPHFPSTPHFLPPSNDNGRCNHLPPSPPPLPPPRRWPNSDSFPLLGLRFWFWPRIPPQPFLHHRPREPGQFRNGSLSPARWTVAAHRSPL